MPEPTPATPKPTAIPRNVTWQPWGYEYTCCGATWGNGHIGHCGS